MKGLYYTFFIVLILLAAAFLYFALHSVPLPAEVSDTPSTVWHLVDPHGHLRSLLPGPDIAKRAIRSLHVAGEGGRPLLVEMQTGLPAWMTGWVTVPGWSRCAVSGWDLCFTREKVAGRIASPRRGPDMYGWMKTSPPLTFTLEGENPFRFESFCPASASEVEGEAGDRRLDLNAFAGESPHLRIALPGMDMKWIRLAPEYGDVSFRYNGKIREIAFGSLDGMAAPGRTRASLFIHYKRSQVLQNLLVPDAIRRSPVVEMLDALDAECHPRERGEACSGRIFLTF